MVAPTIQSLPPYGRYNALQDFAFKSQLRLLIITLSAAQSGVELQDSKTFSKIADKRKRSRGLFVEGAKVLTHPRCMNCHPADDHPRQGNDRHLHMPPVTRGSAGLGVAGNTCQTCHTEENYTLREHTSYESIPSHSRWALAPIEMAWQGKSLTEICHQIKDPKRNGNKTLEMLHEHMAKDELLAWGWKPGAGRDPAPGDQKAFGKLILAWIETGAECP
jgi:hypothetical protein